MTRFQSFMYGVMGFMWAFFLLALVVIWIADHGEEKEPTVCEMSKSEFLQVVGKK